MNPSVPPPGQSPHDPCREDIDAVAFALARVKVMLFWIDEHRVSYEKARLSDPDSAEQEWSYLVDAIEQARKHHERLAELLLAGYQIDPTKRVPDDLESPF